MQIIIFGLGNPGEEYENTRHNTGRIAVEAFRKRNEFDEWESDKKLKALVSEGKIGKTKVLLVLPETFMNNSGKSAALLIKSKKAAENLVVVQDDLDLPLGKIKISFNRGSAGHKGVESIKRAVKTEGFSRIRIGVSPMSSKGVVKKPDEINDFIVHKFKPAELEEIKKVSKNVAEALLTLIKDGREAAMGKFNSH